MKNCLCIILTFFIVSCNDNNFSPYGDSEKRMVTYCILDTRNDKQFVKIQNTYQSDNKILSDELKNISVVISEVGSKSYNLRDTIIDKITNFKIFFGDFKIRKGVNYKVTVKDSLAGKEFTSSTVTPREEVVYTFKHFGKPELEMIFYTGSTKYYDFHIYIEYQIVKDNFIVIKTIEVPIDFIDNLPVYPKIRERNIPDRTVFSSKFWDRGRIGALVDTTSYKLKCFLYAMDNIPEKEKVIKFTRNYLVVYSFSESLSNFINISKGFNDPYSIRTDLPFWTNVSPDGIGVFGAIATDTVIVAIPQR
jgi:hypothetical protein